MDDPDALDDDALMAAWLAGDATAFERLFERHRRPLFGVLLRQCGDRALAEDVFQEAFLRLIRVRHEYAPSGRFRAWLFTIARRTLIDQQRRAGVRRVVRAESTLTDDPGAATMQRLAHTAGRGPDDPAAVSHARDLGRRIDVALQRLPESQREVFLLRERGGLDYAAIAELTGCGLATAKSRMRYALTGLRRLLAGLDVDPGAGHLEPQP